MASRLTFRILRDRQTPQLLAQHFGNHAPNGDAKDIDVVVVLQSALFHASRLNSQLAACNGTKRQTPWPPPAPPCSPRSAR